MRALLLLLACVALPARGQDVPRTPSPDSLTVQQALDRIARGHPLVLAAEARAASRTAASGAVTSWSAPSLAYAMEGIGTGAGFSEQRVIAGIELGPASLARADRQRLNAEARAFGAEAEAVRRALRANVSAAFVDLGVADSLVDLREEALALADDLVQAARLREEGGEASGLETLRAELEAEQARTSLTRAVAQRNAARAAAAATAGLDPSTTRAVAPPLPPLREAPGPLAPEATPPSLLAAQARVEAAEAAADGARASRLPTWSAEVFPQHFGGQTFGAGFQVGVRLPLGQGSLVRSRVSAAESERQAAEADRDGLALARRSAVQAAQARADAAITALDAARGAPTDRAAALLALTYRGYQLGEVTQTVLLDTRRAALSARETGLEAYREALLALVALEQASGASLLFPQTP